MTIKLNFCFKGNRHYIHGTDIIESVIKAMKGECIKSIDIKFNGLSTRNLNLIEGNQSHNAKVNIHIVQNKEEKFYQLVERKEKVKCRVEYNEENIIKKLQLNLNKKEVSLKEHTKHSLYENLIAMNKYLLQKLYPDQKGKWYLTRLEQKLPIDNNSLIKVRFIKNFNFRIAKSDILLNEKTIGSVYFSMTKEKK